MSKITRLEQLENEHSVYRITGLFETSQVCWIERDYRDNTVFVVTPMLLNKPAVVGISELERALFFGEIGIMCLQRG